MEQAWGQLKGSGIRWGGGDLSPSLSMSRRGVQESGGRCLLALAQVFLIRDLALRLPRAEA